jgi:hypothetical protein
MLVASLVLFAVFVSVGFFGAGRRNPAPPPSPVPFASPAVTATPAPSSSPTNPPRYAVRGYELEYSLKEYRHDLVPYYEDWRFADYGPFSCPDGPHYKGDHVTCRGYLTDGRSVQLRVRITEADTDSFRWVAELVAGPQPLPATAEPPPAVVEPATTVVEPGETDSNPVADALILAEADDDTSADTDLASARADLETALWLTLMGAGNAHGLTGPGWVLERIGRLPFWEIRDPEVECDLDAAGGFMCLVYGSGQPYAYALLTGNWVAAPGLRHRLNVTYLESIWEPSIPYGE